MVIRRLPASTVVVALAAATAITVAPVSNPTAIANAPVSASQARYALTNWITDLAAPIQQAAQTVAQGAQQTIQGTQQTLQNIQTAGTVGYGGYVNGSNLNDMATPLQPMPSSAALSRGAAVSSDSGVDPYFPGVVGVYLTGLPGITYYLTDLALHTLGGSDLDNYFFEIGTQAGPGPRALIAGLRAVIYVAASETFGPDSAIAQLAKQHFYPPAAPSIASSTRAAAVTGASIAGFKRPAAATTAPSGTTTGLQVGGQKKASLRAATGKKADGTGSHAARSHRGEG